ncbi:hypothetical protein D3C72_2120080 [compost metagenome]
MQADDQLGQRTLARAAAADDADLLAGSHHQVDVLQGGLLLVRVMEIQLAELDGALQGLTLERPLLFLALLRQAHHLVDRIEGDARLLVAGQQAG